MFSYGGESHRNRGRNVRPAAATMNKKSRLASGAAREFSAHPPPLSLVDVFTVRESAGEVLLPLAESPEYTAVMK